MWVEREVGWSVPVASGGVASVLGRLHRQERPADAPALFAPAIRCFLSPLTQQPLAASRHRKQTPPGPNCLAPSPPLSPPLAARSAPPQTL